ncbi:MAG: hypothetical protein ACLFR1_08275 [Spirochaetia bacterium]
MDDFNLTTNELKNLYRFLKANELGLNNSMYPLLVRLERYLYALLSIEEIENLKQN